MLKVLLYPFAIIYGLITEFRNLLFDTGCLKSVRYGIPVVCIGNITVGGTGKTPHTEYAIKLLSKTHKVAVLSRGYGRKTKGFHWVDTKCLAIEVGDEPLQIKTKFDNIPVAVCESRVEGINRMLEENKNINLIILDDAFQHRAVNASTKILLIDYNRPITNDLPFPAGRLREFARQRKRADVIIYSKCSVNLEPTEMIKIERKLKLTKNQELYFSCMNYGKLYNLVDRSELNITDAEHAIILAGIARPKPFIDYLKSKTKLTGELLYPDHHNFTDKDAKIITEKIEQNPQAIVITTEKDASRLKDLNIKESIKTKIYYIPIEISFLGGNENFDKKLLQHVTNN